MMGKSAGRSSGNRTGEGARRRNTARERDYIDPPADLVYRLDETPRYRLTPRGEKVLTLATWLTYVGLIALGIFLLGVWFGAWMW